MYSIKLKRSDIDPSDSEQVDFLRVMGAIESARVLFELYDKACKGDKFLADKQIVVLNYALASVACALETFKKVIKVGTFKAGNIQSGNTKNDLDFLYSYEVTKFQRKCLKRIRDKSSFHFDKEPAQEALKKIIDEQVKIPLYKVKSKSKRVSFPIAAYMIANWIMEGKPEDTKSNSYNATMMGKILSSINKIMVKFIQNKFPNLVIKTT